MNKRKETLLTPSAPFKGCLTFKKSKEVRGTKDAYIYTDEDVTPIATSIVAMCIVKGFPEGAYGTDNNILLINPSGLLIDKVHTITQLEIEELPQDMQDKLKRTIGTSGDSEVSGDNDDTEDADEDEDLNDAVRSFVTDLLDDMLSKVTGTKTSNTDAPSEITDAIYNAAADEFLKGTMNGPNMNKLKNHPEACFTRFGKILSEKSGESFYADIAKILDN